MAIEGVMISYNYSVHPERAKILTVSASGIKFSERWVLAHGSLISPIKESRAIQNGKAILNDEFYANLPEMHVTCEKKPIDDVYETIQQLSRERESMNSAINLEHYSYTLRVVTGRICHIWQCPMIELCASTIMHSWAIAHRDGELEQQTQIGKTLLSVFVLIDLETDHRDDKVLRPLSALLDMVAPSPNRGSKIEVHSTPFGCEAFLNNATQGLVSGVIGKRPVLLLTDASTSLGSEGGPVFINDGTNKRLVGIVICSVSWWRGEWVGMSILAPLHTVLTTKLRVQPHTVITPIVPHPQNKILDSIDASTVQVRCGAAWGAGVLLAPGYILTCAHVVRNYELYKVWVYCLGRKETAIVRYKSIDDRAYDLALLFTNPQYWNHMTPAVLAKTPIVKGEPVLAVGYPYFTEEEVEDLRPTMTTGHVSNVSPSLLQTTCCIQSGFSGGPIVRVTEDQQVEVVGIITCNAKTVSTASHPHLNMCVPVHVFREHVTRYHEDKDLSRLDAMNNNLDIVQSQWQLRPYRSKI